MMGLLIIGMNQYLTAKLGARKREAGVCPPVKNRKYNWSY